MKSLVMAAALWVGVNIAARAEVRYTVTDLGNLGGAPYATGINSSGKISGYSFTSVHAQWHAFQWTPAMPNGTTGTMQDLGTLGGAVSEANGINNAGQMTGHVDFNLMLYDGIMHVAGFSGVGYAINDAGQVAGQLNFPPMGTMAVYHALIFDSAIHDLGTLGGVRSRALSINSSGQAVGISEYTNDPAFHNAFHAFLYDGAMHDLGTLGGVFSSGNDISNTGQIVGYADLTGSNFTVYHAFLYDGAMHDLGTLGGQISAASGINDQGGIVGTSNIIGNSVNHAFLYTTNGGMVDLNSLIDPATGWVLSAASGLNDFGQIVGEGTLGGQQHAFLLTPVPEPGTSTLAIVGVPICLRALRRRLRTGMASGVRPSP